MSCQTNNFFTDPMYTRHGDTVGNYALIFDVSIIGCLFFYESKPVNVKEEPTKKSIGNGLSIIEPYTLIIDEYVEQRKHGKHQVYLKVVDEDGENTILAWDSIVSPEKVSI